MCADVFPNQTGILSDILALSIFLIGTSVPHDSNPVKGTSSS